MKTFECWLINADEEMSESDFETPHDTVKEVDPEAAAETFVAREDPSDDEVQIAVHDIELDTWHKVTFIKEGWQRAGLRSMTKAKLLCEVGAG